MEYSTNIEHQLAHLGIEGNKARVYLALLKLGKGTVIQISDKAGVRRTTVYDAMDDLEKKSLVKQTFEENKKYYVALPPKALYFFIQEKLDVVKDLVPQLDNVFQSLPTKPKIQYFHGHQGIRDVSLDVLTAVSKKVCYWGDMYEYFKVIKEDKTYNQDFVRGRVKHGIWSYGIWKYDPRVLKFYTPGRNREELREVRFAPQGMVLDVYLQLYDDKVGIISTKGDGYGMIMESRDLNRTLKSVFEILWGISRQYK